MLPMGESLMPKVMYNWLRLNGGTIRPISGREPFNGEDDYGWLRFCTQCFLKTEFQDRV